MTSLGFPGLSSQSVSGFYLSAKVVGQCGTQFLVCLCFFVQVRNSFRICSFKRVLFCQGILSSTSMLAAENTEETNHQAGVLGAGGLWWQLSYRLALPGSIQRGTQYYLRLSDDCCCHGFFVASVLVFVSCCHWFLWLLSLVFAAPGPWEQGPRDQGTGGPRGGTRRPRESPGRDPRVGGPRKARVRGPGRDGPEGA